VILAVTDGLASNLIAEAVGLVAGAFFTYVIVDGLIQRRSHAQTRPLLRRLRDRIDEAVEAMALSWAVVLGMARPEEAIADERHDYIPKVTERLGAAADPEQLLDAVRTNDPQGAWRIASLMDESASTVLSLADRVPNVTTSDIRLEELIADLNDVVSDIEIALRHRSDMQETFPRESGLNLVARSRDAYRRALALKSYADERL
jgi:hypothetical protein